MEHIHTDIEIDICVYACVSIYTFVSKLCPLRRPRSKDTPVATSTPSTQSLVAKYHSPIKGIRSPWKNS